jgi:hypothetical protein
VPVDMFNMRLFLYRLFNSCVCRLPAPLLRKMLNALHREPEAADRIGYQVYPQVFYSPFPVPAEVDKARLEKSRPLPGIEFKAAEFLELLRKLTQFSGEIAEFHKNRTGNLVRWDRTFHPCDTAALQAMLRHLKPKRYIEVGCGFSTRSSTAALSANAKEGAACEALFIEPFPGPQLKEMKLPGEFLERKVQDVPVETFARLEAGDVLFIDTSHVIKVQNDVEYELLRILPSLKPGVIVHVHDIFTPYDYPAEWLVGSGDNRGGNNEQYALECLMSGGGDWEVMLPVHLLWREHRAALDKLMKSDVRPASFWMRKTGLPKKTAN